MNCPKCNCSVLPGQKFCPSCGYMMSIPSADSNTRQSETRGQVSVPCPVCGKSTDSLKVYRLPDMCVSLIVYVRLVHSGHVCCPSCMRKKILIHGFTYNIVTANIAWPILILPWSLVNMGRTFIKGHSREVKQLINGQ